MSEKEFRKWKRNGNFKLTHERILTVSNHIAEGEHGCYTKREAAEVATYHALDASRIASDLQALKDEGIVKYTERLIETFSNKTTKTNPNKGRKK